MLPVAAEKNLGMGAEIVFIIYFYISTCHEVY